MQVCELKTDREAEGVLAGWPCIPCNDETGTLLVVRNRDNHVGVTIRKTLDADVRGLASVRALGCRSGCFGVIGAGFRAALSIDENEARCCDVVRWQRALVEEHAVDGARRAFDFTSFAPIGMEVRGDTTIEISQLAEPRTTDGLEGFYVHLDLGLRHCG